MMFSTADGLVEETLLDMLGKEPVVLRLRASSKSWRGHCRPRLLADCAARLQSNDPSVRLAAMCLLVTAAEAEGRGITVEEARAAAATGLDDPDPDVRRLAVRTFAYVAGPGDPEALERVAERLRDRAWPVRWAAVDALVHAAGDGSEARAMASELLALRVEDKDWPVRRAAAGALMKVAEPADVIAVVTPLLRDEEEDVRIAAVRILVQLSGQGDRVMVAACMERMGDRSPAVRRAAAIALGRLANRGDMAVLAALHAALRDKEVSVQEAAQDALDGLAAA